MDLFVLRHGIAEELGAPGVERDADRALTEEGRARVERVANAMRAMELRFDLLLSSPYLRALQTAEIVVRRCGSRSKLRITEHLAPGGDVRALLRLIRDLRPEPAGVVLCGHEPFLSGLVSLLACGSAVGTVALKKAGLCKLTARTLKAGRCASVEWLLTPRQMGLMR